MNTRTLVNAMLLSIVLWGAILAIALALIGCAPYDPQTFAGGAPTFEQRCADYHADIAAYNSASSLYKLTEAELVQLDTLSNFVQNYCGVETS